MTPIRRFSLLALLLLALLPVAGAQGYPPVWNNTATYAPGDMVTDYGNIYRCILSVSKPYLDPSKAYANWELTYVRNNTTLVIGVGQPFPDLETAWKYALSATIAQGVYLHLSISTAKGNFAENLDYGLNLDHPFGANISIIGDVEANITFNGDAGFTVDSNHALGAMSYFTLDGTGTSASHNAFSAVGGGNFAFLRNIDIENFDVCFSAANLGQINASFITFGPAQGYYAVATDMAQITLTRSGPIDGQEGNESVGVGLKASDGAEIYAPNITMGDLTTGIEAYSGGLILASGASVQDCGSGAYAITRGYIDVSNGDFEGNIQDLYAITAGVIEAAGAAFTSKSTGTNDGSYILS